MTLTMRRSPDTPREPLPLRHRGKRERSGSCTGGAPECCVQGRLSEGRSGSGHEEPEPGSSRVDVPWHHQAPDLARNWIFFVCVSSLVTGTAIPKSRGLRTDDVLPLKFFWGVAGELGVSGDPPTFRPRPPSDAEDTVGVHMYSHSDIPFPWRGVSSLYSLVTLDFASSIFH